VTAIDDRVIIEVGLNENQRRDANPNVPYSPREIGEDARRCWEAGASIVHFHARDPESGEPRLTDPTLNIDTMRAIQSRTDLIAHPTFTNDPMPEGYRHVVEGVEQIDVRWELGHGDLNAPSIDDLQWRLDFCRDHGLRVKSAIFNAGHVQLLRHVLASGWLVADPLLLQFTMGPPGAWDLNDAPARRQPGTQLAGREMAASFTTPATLNSLHFLLRELSDLPIEWMPLVYLADQFQMATLAIALGGHVRIGIGDYAYRERGAPSNAELVEQVVAIARAYGREPASTDEARSIFGIRARAAATGN
jgi:3-keto-5-aminohexanoate cleavage enzyme